MSVKQELGRFIEQKMEERESFLRKSGMVKNGRKLSRNYMAKEVLNVSGTWFSGVINGENMPNDDMLIKIASYLGIDEHTLFRIARRVHPDAFEQLRKDYLGDYYLPMAACV